MTVAFSKPVEDSVDKINEDVAVGEDLDFQRRWWKFERAVWSLFVLIIGLDLAGAFGRGPIAHAQLHATDKTLNAKYERIERAGTPSILDISFGSSAIRDGKIKLYVSESIVADLGAQRIIPAPNSSEVGNGGVTYTFPASGPPDWVQFALQPASPGIFHFTIQVPDAEAVHATVVVVP